MRAEHRTLGTNRQPAPPEQPGTALHPSNLPNGPAHRPGWCDAMRRKQAAVFHGFLPTPSSHCSYTVSGRLLSLATPTASLLNGRVF